VAHDPVRGGLAPKLVAFGLDAGHPVDDGAPHRFGDVDPLGITAREWQCLDRFEPRQRDRLRGLENGGNEWTIGASYDGAGFHSPSQFVVADGIEDSVGKFAGVARGAERTRACCVDRHVQAERMSTAQQPDALGHVRRETRRRDRRIAFRSRKRGELDVEEIRSIVDRPCRRRRRRAGEHETRACGQGRKQLGQKPGGRQAPGVDIVDHDDRNVLEARKRRGKLSHRSRLLVDRLAKRAQDCGRRRFDCACRYVKVADALILKAGIQCRHECRLADAGGAINIGDDRSSLGRHLAQQAQFRVASRQSRAAPLAYQVGYGRSSHEAIFSSITHETIMTSSTFSVYTGPVAMKPKGKIKG